ncbi:hypothetical protein FOZ61_005055 [Perkinsus olseni]|uniref:Uncharacterized protein n=1 Tax=Perkinsus olseni TaxID=32597 RepID=A0A7J6LJI3_PEROL|nr:hypothetical protein FOZ61_005055 [Perkinsus olseni]
MPRGVANLLIDLEALDRTCSSSDWAVTDLKYHIYEFLGRREPVILRLSEAPRVWRCPEDAWWADHAFKYWGGGSCTAASPLTKRVHELPVGRRELLVHDEAHGSPTRVIPLSRHLGTGDLLPAEGFLDNVVVIGQSTFVAAVRRSDRQYTAVLVLDCGEERPRVLCVTGQAGYHFDILRKDDGSFRALISVVHFDSSDGRPGDNLTYCMHILDFDGDGVVSRRTLPVDPQWGRSKPRFITADRLLLSESIPCPESSMGWQRELSLLYIGAGVIKRTPLSALDGGTARADLESAKLVKCWNDSTQSVSRIAVPHCSGMPRGLSNLAVDLAAVDNSIPPDWKGVLDITYMICQYIGRRDPVGLSLKAPPKPKRPDDEWWRKNALNHKSAIADPLTKLHYQLDVCDMSGCGHLLLYDDDDDSEGLLGACLSERGIGGHEDVDTSVVDKLVLFEDCFYVGLANYDEKVTEFNRLTRVDLKVREFAKLNGIALDFSIIRKPDGKLRIAAITQNRSPLAETPVDEDGNEIAGPDTFHVTEINILDEGFSWIQLPTWPLVDSRYVEVHLITPDVALLADFAPSPDRRKCQELTLLRLFTEGDLRTEQLSRIRLDGWSGALSLSPCASLVMMHLEPKGEECVVCLDY